MVSVRKLNAAVDERIDRLKHSVTRAQKWALFSTILWGLAAHIPSIANDLINHDSVNGLHADANYWLSQQGKWAAGYIISFLRGALTVPSWFVLLGIIGFACSAFLIVRMFNIKSSVCAALIGGILVANDAVMSMTLAYGTDYFAFCFLLMVIAVYCARMYRFGWPVSIGLITLSMGGYQPMIGAATSMFVMLCIVDALRPENTFKKLLLSGLKYIAILLVGGALYYGILQLLIDKGIVVLNSYKNINELASGGLTDTSRMFELLRDTFLYPYMQLAGRLEVPYNQMNTLNKLCGVLIIFSYVWAVINNKIYKSPLKFIASIILAFGVFPVAVNLVDFLTQDEVVSRIMRYSIVLLYCLPVVLCGACLGSDKPDEVEKARAGEGKKMINRVMTCIICVVVSVMVLDWCCLDHDGYGYVSASNKQMSAKSAILMNSIYQCEGYEPGTPVALIGKTPIPFYDDTNSATALYDVIGIKKGTQGIFSASDTMYILQMVARMLNVRLGANLQFVDSADFYAQHTDECDAMPVYPVEGSVAMIDGTIVVKLNEVYK